MSEYNSIMAGLLNKHAPIITKPETHASIAGFCANFFTNKVFSISISHLDSPNKIKIYTIFLLLSFRRLDDTTLIPTTSFNLLELAAEAEIITLIQASQNK